MLIRTGVHVIGAFMRYTQSQIRDLLGLSVETLRAWRGVVPFLGERKGHAPTFTSGDLVALAAISELVGTFGVRIGSIAEQAQMVFELCHDQSWLGLENCIIVLDGTAAHLTVTEGQWLGTQQPMWIVPCSPLITRLRNMLSAPEAPQQGHLQFPPLSIARRP